MEHFQNAVNKFPVDKTNLTKEEYGFTIEELYNMTKPYLEVIHNEFKFTNIKLPKRLGANSLVFIAYCNDIDKMVAIKIALVDKVANNPITKSVIERLNSHEIIPRVIYNNIFDIKLKAYDLSIMISSYVISLETFKFTNVMQLKNAIYSFLNGIRNLHNMKIVHRDIKSSNLGLDENGRLYLFDFDNSSSVSKSCHLESSTLSCYPPDTLIRCYKKLNFGNMIIDWFSCIMCILGVILKFKKWDFEYGIIIGDDIYDYTRLDEKEKLVNSFDLNRLYNDIEKKIRKNYPDYKFELDNFWYIFCNIVHLIFKGCNDMNPYEFKTTLEALICKLGIEYSIR